MQTTDSIENPTTDSTLSVLRYWHLLEFFVPFNLDDACSNPASRYLKLSAQKFHDADGNRVLPWLSPAALTKAGGDMDKQYYYQIYCLPFNKNELTRLSIEHFPLSNDVLKQVEFEERFDDEIQKVPSCLFFPRVSQKSDW